MTELKRLSSIYFTPHGQVICFDEDGQVPEMQKLNMPCLLAEKARELGYDITDLVIETPSGRVAIQEIEGELHWRIL